jgi:hypothetical protein
MLSCAEFLAEFGDYLEEAASPEVRAHLEEHLRECKTCQVIVDSTRKTIRIVTDSDSFTLSAGSSGAHRSRRHGPNPRKEAVAPAKDYPQNPARNPASAGLDAACVPPSGTYDSPDTLLSGRQDFLHPLAKSFVLLGKCGGKALRRGA